MIVLKSTSEIQVMYQAGQIVAEILEELRSAIEPGMSTAELDRIAEAGTLRRGARPAFKGYSVGTNVFPSTLCISINEEVVHGIPSPRRTLRNGDVVGLDFGVQYDGFYADSAVTVSLAGADRESERLIEVTKKALDRGIEEAWPGRRLGDISAAIQETVEVGGFSIVRDFVGHGIGVRLHEEPQVPNFGERNRGIRLREGMVLAIEPMVNAGGPEVRVLEDGWTAVTRDGSRSAHFEHSVAITSNGPVVLSESRALARKSGFSDSRS